MLEPFARVCLSTTAIGKRRRGSACQARTWRAAGFVRKARVELDRSRLRADGVSGECDRGMADLDDRSKNG